MNTIRFLLTAGRDLFAGVTTPRNDILLATTGPLSHSAITTTIHLTPTNQYQPPSAAPPRKRKAASELTDPLATANLTIKRLRRTVLAFQHQERAFAQTSRLKDAALREARLERAEFEARRRWWEGREEELEEKLLMEKVDNEIFAGVEFERGYRVGREEGRREGRKEGIKEAQGMFLGGFEDEVEGEGSLAEEEAEAPQEEKGSLAEEEAEAPQEEKGSLAEEEAEAPQEEKGSLAEEEAEAPQEEEEEDMGAGAGPTATVRPRVAARALVLDEDYDDEKDKEDEEAEEETYEGVIKIPSDDEIIIFWD